MARIRFLSINLPWVGGGASWEYVKDQDKITATQVVRLLEDRRVLFGDRHLEDELHCLHSVFEIRRYLTERLTTDDISDDLARALKGMRAACRRFIEAGGPDGTHFRQYRQVEPSSKFSLALGDFRSRMGFYIAALGLRYEVEVEEDLAAILPPTPTPEDDDLSWVPGF